jgi:hypothetical protein
LYDQYLGRFIVTILASKTATDRSDSWILLAVSQTAVITEGAALNDQFNKFSIKTSTADHWSQDMGLGVDETTLHAAYRMAPKTTGDPFVRQHIINIAAAAGPTPPPMLENQFFNNIADAVDGRSGFMQPVHSFGSTFGEFYVSYQVGTEPTNHLSVYNRDGYGGSINLAEDLECQRSTVYGGRVGATAGFLG